MKKFNLSKLGFVYKVAISILIVVAFVLAIVGFVSSVRANTTSSVQKLDDGWDVAINDTVILKNVRAYLSELSHQIGNIHHALSSP